MQEYPYFCVVLFELLKISVYEEHCIFGIHACIGAGVL